MSHLVRGGISPRFCSNVHNLSLWSVSRYLYILLIDGGTRTSHLKYQPRWYMSSLIHSRGYIWRIYYRLRPRVVRSIYNPNDCNIPRQAWLLRMLSWTRHWNPIEPNRESRNQFAARLWKFTTWRHQGDHQHSTAEWACHVQENDVGRWMK